MEPYHSPIYFLLCIGLEGLGLGLRERCHSGSASGLSLRREESWIPQQLPKLPRVNLSVLGRERESSGEMRRGAAHPRRRRAQSLFHRRHPICLSQKAWVGGGAEKGGMEGEILQSVS